jgi:hypothetical protein
LFAIFLFADPTYAASGEEEVEGGTSGALQVTQAPAEEGVSLRFYDLMSPCSRDCRDCLLTGAYGRYVETSMSNIFFDLNLAPWDWSFGDITFASITFGRKLADYGRFISFEPEVGVGRRFGDADEYEFWGALYMRWNPFFWDHIIDTSIAISTGVSYASDNNELEEKRVKDDASFLHYFSNRFPSSFVCITARALVVFSESRVASNTLCSACAHTSDYLSLANSCR